MSINEKNTYKFFRIIEHVFKNALTRTEKKASDEVVSVRLTFRTGKMYSVFVVEGAATLN